MPSNEEPPLSEADELLYEAWAVIANVGHGQGGWDTQHRVWLDAAIRWRDRWHAHLGRARAGSGRPPG